MMLVFQFKPILAICRYLLAIAVLGFGVTCAMAQSPGRDETGPRPANPPSATGTLPAAPVPATPAPLDKLPASIQYLPDGKGGAIAVPADANLELFLEWLRQRRLQNLQNAAGPTASVTAVELEGETDDQMATLNCHLTVQIAGDQFPMSYAVGLGEAVFRRKEVKGPGQVFFGGRDRERGYVWWFDKPGEYEFTLQLTVPLLKASPWRRLQLSVPNSPVTSLRLEVPSGSVVVKAPDDVIQTVRLLDDKRSEIRAAGFGGKVEILSWQPTVAATEGPAGLEVISNIAVRSTNDAFLLDTTQFVRAFQGSFREFTVILPTGTESFNVDGAEISESRVDEQLGDMLTRVTVVLKSATTGTISVRWQVRVPHLSRRNFDLDGFRVEGARRESGEIGFLAVEGYRWNVAEADPHVGRLNAGEFRMGGARTTAVRACQFFSQPFKLPTTLEPVEPYFDVGTLFAVTAAEKEIGLEARFKVRVYRGQLPELSIVWPGWRTEGWRLAQPKGAMVTNVTTDDEAGQGRIVVSLGERPTDEAFELRLFAQRLRMPNEDLSISLPRVLAPAGSPTRLVLLSDENIEASLVPRGETLLRPYLPQSSATDAVSFPSEKRPQDFRIDSDERAFQLALTTQAQQITVASEVSGTLTSRRMEMRQRLLHRVAYARLNEIKVSVPTEISQQVKFSFASTLQTPQWSEGVGGRERIATILLPEPMIGEIPLDVVWSIPVPKEILELLQDQEATLPLLVPRSLTGPTTSHRLRVEQPAWLDLSLVEPSWRVEYADDQEITWSNSSPTETMTLRVKPASAVRGEGLVVRKAIARVHVDRGGVQHSRFEIGLSGSLRQVHVQLPRAAQAGEFLWNDVPLSAEALTEVPEGSGRFSLSLPEKSTGAPEEQLTIEYRLPTGKILGWSTGQTLSVPVLPQCRWMADIAWEVSFPSNQHLFGYPDTATPWFHWERSGVIWRRASPALLSSSHGRNGSATAVAAASHVYAFGQFGTLSPFSVRCISTPAALCWGAGATFALGVFLLKISRLSAVFTAGLAAAAVLIAELWFQPQIELLMQPMLVGAAFPIASALFGWWKRQALPSTVLTIDASPSDVRSRSGSQPATQSLRALHPDSATVYRPAVSPEPPSVRVAAESHLG